MNKEFVLLLTFVQNALPLIGVILGAGLQHFFSRSAELKRHKRTLRMDAYSDYLRSVGEAETLKVNPDPTHHSEVFARAISAKARICVHGSASAIEALSRFEGTHGQGLTLEKKKYFLEFVAAVRTDTAAKGTQLSQLAVEKILFGVKGGV